MGPTLERSSIPEEDVKSSLQKAVEQLEKEDLSEDDRADALQSIEKLQLELEKPEREPGRIARFWKRLKEVTPTVGGILSSAKTIAEILKQTGVL